MPDAIIQPRRGRNSPRLGPVAVLAAAEADVKLLRGALGFSADEGRPLHISRLYTASDRHPGISLAGPLVGAPYAVMLAESLIAWGARQILFLGWCGVLSKPVDIGDVVLPTSALIDEGTSRHYLPDICESFPSALLVERLSEICTSDGLVVHKGPVWTTDAPFRETREKVIACQRRGVLAVEMEASGLFSLGAFRRADVAALLVASDDLSDLSWRAGFKDPRFAGGREAAGRIIGKLCEKLTSP
ncbi:MAG: nucleoside phosphorylase [Hyphomicrobiales bacterium]